ncbi:MAG TPA: hypothetical protein VIP05_33885 [Burkholderiaceae bacterium]
MKSSSRRASLALAAACLLAPHAHAATAAYHFVDLGKLSEGNGVNAHKQVAGKFQYQPAVHAADGWHVLAADAQGWAAGLDALGNAAGNVYDSNSEAYVGYYWPTTGGSVPILVPQEFPYHDPFVYAVAPDGTVVGSVTDVRVTSDCFLWRAGDAHLRPLSTGLFCEPHAIVSHRLFAGTGSTSNDAPLQAFLWDGTQFHWLAGLGGIGSDGFGLNKDGVVVGEAWTPAGANGVGVLHATVWPDTSSAPVDLGTLPGKAWSQAYAINGAGVVVGSSSDVGRQNAIAFVVRDGVMTDLNTLVDDAHGMVLTAPHDINDKGVIVGSDMFKGAEHGWMLVPIAQ